MKTKKCSRCKKNKAQNQFNKNKGTKSDGLRSECKKCQGISLKIWYYNTKETRRIKKRKWRMKQRYGINFSGFLILFNKQNGRCAICGKLETTKQNGRRISLAIDHNHKTMKIRGLLCRKCNIGIGYFEDNIKYLRKAAIYLSQHS